MNKIVKIMVILNKLKKGHAFMNFQKLLKMTLISYVKKSFTQMTIARLFLVRINRIIMLLDVFHMIEYNSLEPFMKKTNSLNMFIMMTSAPRL